MPTQKPAQKKPVARRELVSDPAARHMLGGISQMTKKRWESDPRIGWPPVAAVVRGRNYYLRADLEALLDRLVQKTASGESKVVAPIPTRRRPQPERGGAMP